ncbi:MAG: Pyrrolo-quinoline quinone [Solirubrobacterales bacterium]|nr:Pyrrolo-quinoline quinone [Solirubrobacterales bacterium]
MWRRMGAGFLRAMRDLAVLAATLASAVVLVPSAGAAVVTGAGDDLRTGWYPESGALTPQLVSGGSFGQLWSTSVEGSVYAQPLLANGTLLVATEKNEVYGLDPATGALKWPKPLSLGTPWNPSDIGCADLTPSIGVTATPVIDTSTNTAYMTHKTYASGSSGPASWYMDAIDISSGLERPGFPVELGGAAQNAPARTFSPTTQLQRPGLLLLEGVVYAAFGSHCDTPPWQGWIFGVSTAGKVTARYVDNQTKEGAGIWQSGSGLTSDGPGTILFASGNGGAPAEPAAGATPPANLGESVVRVRVQGDGSLRPVDFFAPFNAPTLDSYDSDFASGGVTGLPSQYFGTAALPHLAVADGKQGYVYLLNRDSLGGIGQGAGGSDNVIQRLGPRGGVWSRPGVWPGDGGYVYIPTSSGSSAGGDLDVYKYGVSGSGAPSLALAAHSPDAFGWGSGAPVITSSGTTSGSALVWIVWSANRTGSGGQLRAYDPVPVGGQPVLRYQSSIGTASNYNVPGVGEGRVYVGNREGKVLAFGSPVKPPLSGAAVSFPTTRLGSSTQRTLTLTANEPLTLSSLKSSSTQFEVAGSTPPLPATLASGQTVTVPVTFAPIQTGLVAATLTATTTAGKQVQFALSGTGQSQAAQLVLSPPVLSFQATPIGGERTEAATLRNGGGETLTIEKITLPAAPFAAEDAPKANSTIGPGESLDVTVAFKPTAAGAYEGALALQTSGGDGQIGLSGSAGAPGLLAIAGETLEYGSLPLGAAATKSFTITNRGGSAVPITKSKPPIGGEFAATTSLPEGTTIQAGESVTEGVAFAPTELGPAFGEWLINGEDASGLHRVLLQGAGASSPPPAPGETSQPQTPASATAAQGTLGGKQTTSAGPAVAIVGRSVWASRRGTVRLQLRCPASENSCLGTIELDVNVAARPGRPAGAPSAKLMLAAGVFTLGGGQGRTVTLRLSSKARALLRRAHVLNAYATVAARDQSGGKRTTHAHVTIHAYRATRRGA